MHTLKNNKNNKDDIAEFTHYAQEAIKKKDIFLKCAEKFKTPLYVLDEESLIMRTREFMDVFKRRIPKTEIFYAFKSNDLPYMISLLKKEGCNADVAGIFELMLALKLGFKKIMFTGPMKSEEELELVIKNCDKVIINIDNTDELSSLFKKLENKKLPDKEGKKVKVSFRIRPSESAIWSKFGLPINELKKEASRVIKNSKTEWTGIHFHSSWNEDSRKQVKNIKEISSYLNENFTAEELSTLAFFDVGGGFIPQGHGEFQERAKEKEEYNPSSSTQDSTRKHIEKNIKVVKKKAEEIDSFAEDITKTLKESVLCFLPNIAIWLEPGRYISSIPNHILLKAVSVDDTRIIVDGGINLLGSANFDFEYSPILNISRPSLKDNTKKIYGPLCDPDDHWGNRYFGEECKKGDILLVMHQGAYSFSTAWRWQKPIAAYASFRGNSIKIVKKEEDFEQRYSGCLI